MEIHVLSPNPPKNIEQRSLINECNQTKTPENYGPFYFEERIYNLQWKEGRGAVGVPKYCYYIYGYKNRIIVIDIKTICNL